MKNLFPAFYSDPTEPEKLWEDAVITFDTNALLRIFEFNQDARQEWLAGLKYLREDGRLFLTHQAASEYHLQVTNRITKTKESSSNLWKKPAVNFKKDMEALISNSDSPLIGVEKIHAICEPFLKQVDNFSSELKSVLEEWRKQYLESAYQCMSDLADVFDSLVGQSFSDSDLQTYCRLAQVRYEQKIPPGYLYDGSSELGNQYGDVMLWFQLIQFAKENKKPVVLVTYEGKADWLLNGRPRPELVNEMLIESGMTFDLASPIRFSEWIGRKLKIKEPVSVAEINRLTISEPPSFPHFMSAAPGQTGEVGVYCNSTFYDQYNSLSTEDQMDIAVGLMNNVNKMNTDDGMITFATPSHFFDIDFSQFEDGIVLTNLERRIRLLKKSLLTQRVSGKSNR
ncbi:MAG: PIN-like domain-containing protein [Candidatus Melainabacteria bacterium]|nr:PIN-like domain-containing protein [Candidatus Melainabacteria bacterium]